MIKRQRNFPLLLERGRRNGVEGLRILSRREIKNLEPNVEGVAAILSPSTDIVDSHGLMRYFVARAREGGAQIAYRTKVVGVEKIAGGYWVAVEDDAGESVFITRVLINCACRHCDRVAEPAGINIDEAGYRLHYCKGEFFSVGNNRRGLVGWLVYPVPPPQITGVGIHISFDLDGRMRLGPGIQYVDSPDYAVDPGNKQLFYDSVKKFLPWIEYDDLESEMAGIRPKLQEPGGDFRDFVINEESAKNLPGLVNLIGIESPGLTTSPAIVEYVASLIAP